MNDRSITDRRRARRMFAIMALWVPLVIIVVSTIAQVLMLPSLPSPAAIHWSSFGAPDGFGPGWLFPLMTVVIGILDVALCAGSVLHASRGDRGSSTYRLMATISGFVAVFLAVLLFGSALMQAGLEDASQADNLGWTMLIGLIAGVVYAAVSFAFTENTTVQQPERSQQIEPLDIPDTEQAVWIRTATMSRAAGITLGLVLGAVSAGELALCLVLMRTGQAGPVLWISLAAVLLVTLAAAFLMRFTIRIDEAGLEARSQLGVPRIAVPIQQITSVQIVEVRPLAEFGGWGWRLGPAGQGIVLRGGEGIRIGRDGKSDLTITVDDAQTAAALLRRNMSRTAS